MFYNYTYSTPPPKKKKIDKGYPLELSVIYMYYFDYIECMKGYLVSAIFSGTCLIKSLKHKFNDACITITPICIKNVIIMVFTGGYLKHLKILPLSTLIN